MTETSLYLARELERIPKVLREGLFTSHAFNLLGLEGKHGPVIEYVPADCVGSLLCPKGVQTGEPCLFIEARDFKQKEVGLFVDGAPPEDGIRFDEEIRMLVGVGRATWDSANEFNRVWLEAQKTYERAEPSEWRYAWDRSKARQMLGRLAAALRAKGFRVS